MHPPFALKGTCSNTTVKFTGKKLTASRLPLNELQGLGSKHSWNCLLKIMGFGKVYSNM